MFDETSRYADLPTTELRLADGRRVRYAHRRFLPQGASLPVVSEIATTDADRLDLLAARTLDDPTLYWRICDANDAMNPATLLATPDRRLRVPLTDQYS
jgi:hypothetical protein